jgi:hypothetical protein
MTKIQSSADANLTGNRFVESKKTLPTGFVIDSAIYYTTVELNNAGINYENKFVITAAILSLLTPWGITDKTRKTTTYVHTRCM